jgi:broad specificity phosphatase PhoE
MGRLTDKMLSRLGKTRADINPQSRAGKLFRQEGVAYTPELQRVVDLPRRQWQEGADELADVLTRVFARDGGSQVLRPVQAAALRDIHDCGGAMLAIRVSGGKTLISFLAPAVVEAQRPLLLVPGKLKYETEVKWWQYQKDWVLPRIRVESYELLGREQHASYLENYRPDLILADEGHKLKNPKSAVTRRVKRYLQAHPDTTVVIMSGTVTSRTLHDYWHLLRWTHGEERMPMPADWPEMTQWSEAIDVHAKAIKMAAGALVLLANEDEQRDIQYGGEAAIQATRKAYQRRFVETPGVVSTVDDKGVNCSITIEVHDVPAIDRIQDTFTTMRATWETPDGHPFEMASQLWAHCRELACGFYYVWDPRPPKEWLVARRRWSRFVRETLKGQKYDSDGQVAKAVLRGHLNDREVDWDPVEMREVQYRAYFDWAAVRDTFKPKTVAKWVSDATIKWAAAWLDKHKEGVVFVEHDAFGRALSDYTGVPYFGAGGVDAGGNHIIHCTGKAIASVHANREGRNLQHWSEALVVSELPNGAMVEQLLGRLHRDGQQADNVHFDWLVASLEHWLGFHKILRDANYIQYTTGQPQKVLMADIIGLPSEEEMAEREGGRWTSST